MDIIDILVAKAMTPQGQIDVYAAKAGKAIADAERAVSNIDTITQQTTDNNETALASVTAANQALENANGILELANDALARIDDTVIPSIDSEIDKLTHALAQHTTDDGIFLDFITTYPSGLITTLQNIVKYYNSTGQNIDGTMTQKAITDEIQRIINSGETTPSFMPEDAGYIPVIQSNGVLGVSNISESDLVEALAKTGVYHIKDTIGLTIDYESRTFTRVHEAADLSAGEDFNKYLMYGGRKRCNVDNSGQIIAWYGENNYEEDGSNGDVMIYQPKFYYQRVPTKTSNGIIGKIVRQETISISYIEKPGFKIHPIFIDENNNILDYVLLPAYESCYYDTSEAKLVKDDSGTINFNTDILRSCADAKPVSGVTNNLTVVNAEHMANNHGAGWHITNIAAESVNQMLMLIEFGTLNGQSAIESGLSNLPNVDNKNCASQTGSTASLGNATGVASSTINITNNITNVYDVAGRRAITYRGFENPWGNTWRFIGGLNIYGNGAMQGGIPYVCTDFNYTPSNISNNYESVGFCLPSANGWISAMGYGDERYDWVLMPAETNNANSALPVGDNIWTTSNLNGINAVQIGGNWQQQENNGLFYYACDNDPTRYSRTVNARLMHIPTYQSSVYTANIASWLNQIQG